MCMVFVYLGNLLRGYMFLYVWSRGVGCVDSISCLGFLFLWFLAGFSIYVLVCLILCLWELFWKNYGREKRCRRLSI